MIKSMTGFGKATCEASDKKVTVEVRSLNSKQLDLNMRLPSIYKENEGEIRTEIVKKVERGKVDFSVYYEFSNETSALSLNKTLVKTYHQELKLLALELGESTDNLFPLIFKMPDVLKSERQEVNETELEQLKITIAQALTSFNQFREDEGYVLKNDIEKRIQTIAGLLEEVKELDMKRIPSQRERLMKNLAELVDKQKIDMNRFEQELIYYMEKLDITEEVVRLKTHCDYFIKTMVEDSSGRKLGFISQEIGREINTIGSKANDAGIQKVVVQMKDELEKVKEQLNNVL